MSGCFNGDSLQVLYLHQIPYVQPSHFEYYPTGNGFGFDCNSTSRCRVSLYFITKLRLGAKLRTSLTVITVSFPDFINSGGEKHGSLRSILWDHATFSFGKYVTYRVYTIGY